MNFVLEKKCIDILSVLPHTSYCFPFVLQKLIEVQDFLKVPQMDLKSRQVKIHKGSLSQRVENWDDIEKALKGPPYESFLHEDYKI